MPANELWIWLLLLHAGTVRVDTIDSSHEGSWIEDTYSGLVSLGRTSDADWVGVPVILVVCVVCRNASSYSRSGQCLPRKTTR